MTFLKPVAAAVRLIMDAVTPQYPPLTERRPLSTTYLGFTFLLAILPFFIPQRRGVAICVFSILLFRCLSAPQYTFGNPSDDYYNSSFLIAMVLWFLEFGILAPETGSGAPAYTGNPGSIDVGKTTLNETESQWERLHWVASLMVPSHRGIGWNWQVKGVPDDPMKDATKPKFMRSHAMKMLGSYVRSVCMLMLLGWASAMEKRMASYHDARLQNLLTNALIGWSGATWVWDRLNFAYSSMAFLSVFSGMSATWQWPPLMGRLRDAWSVRQMWSVVYHQIMRKVKCTGNFYRFFNAPRFRSTSPSSR